MSLRFSQGLILAPNLHPIQVTIDDHWSGHVYINCVACENVPLWNLGQKCPGCGRADFPAYGRRRACQTEIGVQTVEKNNRQNPFRREDASSSIPPSGFWGTTRYLQVWPITCTNVNYWWRCWTQGFFLQASLFFAWASQWWLFFLPFEAKICYVLNSILHFS